MRCRSSTACSRARSARWSASASASATATSLPNRGTSPKQDDAGLGVWQKLMVYAGEQARHGGRPLSSELVRRLREEGASGATSVRGIWGFSGDNPPHGDRLFRAPPAGAGADHARRHARTEIQRGFAIVDEMHRRGGARDERDGAGVPCSRARPARGRPQACAASPLAALTPIVRALQRGEAPAEPRSPAANGLYQLTSVARR